MSREAKNNGKAARRYDGITGDIIGQLTHNLKVVGSNPTPATKLKARDVSALGGFFVRQFAQIAPQSANPRSAIRIKAFLTRIIV